MRGASSHCLVVRLCLRQREQVEFAVHWVALNIAPEAPTQVALVASWHWVVAPRRPGRQATRERGALLLLCASSYASMLAGAPHPLTGCCDQVWWARFLREKFVIGVHAKLVPQAQIFSSDAPTCAQVPMEA